MSESSPSSSPTEEIPCLTPSPAQQKQQNMTQQQCQISTSDPFSDTDSYLDALAVASAATQLVQSLNFDDDSVSTAATSGVQQQQLNLFSGTRQTFAPSPSSFNPESQNAGVSGTQLESQALMRQPSRGTTLMMPNLVVEDTSVNDACQLPDVPMLKIMARLSLYELLLTLPQVSPSPTWTKLVNDSSHSRRHLTILLGPEAGYRLEEVLTKFPDLPPADAHSQIRFVDFRLSPEEACSVLTSKLPRISSLTLAITRMDEQEYAQILRLLHTWADTLTQVIIAIQPERSTRGQATRDMALSLQGALNGLSQLHHLTILMYGWFATELSTSSFLLDLSVFSTLEVLNLWSDCSDFFFKSIVDYMAGSAAARSISFGNYFEASQVEKVLSMPEAVTRLIRTVDLLKFLPEAQFINLTAKCTNLTSLILDLDNHTDEDDVMEILPLPLLSRRLRSLPLLTSLTLHTGDLGPHLDAIEEHRQSLPADEERVLYPLPSVTTLTVIMFGSLVSHDDFISLYLDQLLPNLERLFLYIDDYRCPLCDLSWSNIDYHGKRSREDCAIQLVAPLLPLLSRLQLARAWFDLDWVGHSNLPFSNLITGYLAEEMAAAKAQREKEEQVDISEESETSD